MNALPINDIAEGGLILMFYIAYPFTGERTISPMFLQHHDKSMQWFYSSGCFLCVKMLIIMS
jgi:hypothetical protein